MTDVFNKCISCYLLKIDYYVLLCFVCRQEKIDKKNQHKVVQCLKAIMNNKVTYIYFQISKFLF